MAQSDFLANKKRTILALVQGLDGPIQVNGKNYDGAMPAATLDDPKVADVLTYVPLFRLDPQALPLHSRRPRR